MNIKYNVKDFLEQTERAAEEMKTRRRSKSGMANLLVCCRSDNPRRILSMDSTSQQRKPLKRPLAHSMLISHTDPSHLALHTEKL